MNCCEIGRFLTSFRHLCPMWISEDFEWLGKKNEWLHHFFFLPDNREIYQNYQFSGFNCVGIISFIEFWASALFWFFMLFSDTRQEG